MSSSMRVDSETPRGRRLSPAEELAKQRKKDIRFRHWEKKQERRQRMETRHEEQVRPAFETCDNCGYVRNDVYPYLVENHEDSNAFGARIRRIVYHSMVPQKLCGDCINDLVRRGEKFEQMPTIGSEIPIKGEIQPRSPLVKFY